MEARLSKQSRTVRIGPLPSRKRSGGVFSCPKFRFLRRAADLQCRACARARPIGDPDPGIACAIFAWAFEARGSPEGTGEDHRVFVGTKGEADNWVRLAARHIRERRDGIGLEILAWNTRVKTSQLRRTASVGGSSPPVSLRRGVAQRHEWVVRTQARMPSRGDLFRRCEC